MPYYITCADQETFFLAGLWDWSQTEGGDEIECCTVITMPANELMAQVHNSKKVGNTRVLLPMEERRMPAILAKEDHENWLTGSAEAAFAALKPYPSGLMHAHPVSNRVNTTRNQGPDLIPPWKIDPPRQ